jgi:SAM-dependent methyltransferase
MYTPQGSWGSKDTVAHKHDGLSPAALALVSDAERFRGGDPDGATVLDIGCGVGYILDAFAHRGYRTFGIEPATDVAFDVHQRLAAVPRDTRYDVVILNHVIEHLTEPFDLLNQAADAVAEGGVLVIGVPGLDSLPTHGNLRYVVNGHHHLCAFSRACLQRALRRRGFCAFRVLDDGTTTRRMRLIAARFEDGAGQNDDVEAAFRTLEAFGRLHAVTGERS